ncbi:MAG: putative transcription regulator, TetR family protein [Myxococcales bacterium]
MTKRRARGELTRVQVLEATLRLLAREGPRGVTHRAVAAEGGTSVRATTYYFASREQLLGEALVHYADTAIGRIDALTATLGALPKERAALREKIADLLALSVLSNLGDRTGLIAEYELILETARNPTLEDTYRRWQERLECLIRHFALELGSDAPEEDTRIVLAVLRGVEMEALSRPSREAGFAELRQTMGHLLAGLEAGMLARRAG